MRPASISDRKLNIIEQLIILNDNEVFDQVENILNASLHRPQFSEMSNQELIHRAELSNIDIQNGDVFSQEEVERMSQNW